MEIHDAGLVFNGTLPNGGYQKTIDTIILHHAGASNMTVEAIHNYHKNVQKWWGIGYHYYIRKDGTIWRGRPENVVGSHAGSKTDYNRHSIGICFEGNFETEQMTDAQVEAGRWLVADIKSRYTIKNVLKHKDVAATACPGANFRWKEVTEPTWYDASTPVAVKVGTALVAGKQINGITYVPLNEFVNSLTQQFRVEWSKETGTTVLL